MTKKEHYKQELQQLENWDDYILKNSNLPGPRANLELMQAFVQTGTEEKLTKYLPYNHHLAPVNSPEEFLAFCSIAGLGKLIAQGKDQYIQPLKDAASDPRWRIREAVAWSLQSIGKSDFSKLIKLIEPWTNGNLLEQRAAAAGLCEPSLLKKESNALMVLAILDVITRALIHTGNRKDEDFKILRKGLGYCWSVAIVANPEAGKTVFEQLTDIHDPDIRWIMKENLKKNRLLKMDPEWVEKMNMRHPCSPA